MSKNINHPLIQQNDEEKVVEDPRPIEESYFVDRCNDLASRVRSTPVPRVEKLRAQMTITRYQLQKENLPTDEASVKKAAKAQIRRQKEAVKSHKKDTLKMIREECDAVFTANKMIGDALFDMLVGLVEVLYQTAQIDETLSSEDEDEYSGRM